MSQPQNNNEIRPIIQKLSFRLEQARRISDAAESCSVDEDRNRALGLLEDFQELVRNATHLVSAALIMHYPEHTDEIGSEEDS